MSFINRRLEDADLLRGLGRFGDDLPVRPDTLHAAILRSPHAHAEIQSLDFAGALAVPGVDCVLTGEDARRWSRPFAVAVKTAMEQWCLAMDRVRYVGEPVAVVLARNHHTAEDAGRVLAHRDYCVFATVALQYCSSIAPRTGDPRMEFGMFHQFPALPGRTEREAFAEAFEQIDAAERWGLDTMWLAELHFDPQRSVLSAPLSIASAVGARTERIKIGIAVQVLPLCHPLRLAEEAATVDHISGGRLIFGVGRSGLPRTYEDYGVSYAESRDRFTEVLDIVELAWSQPGFSYEGKYYNFKNITVAPKPVQQPYPPIRIAAASPDTYPAVGERGLPIFINARYGSFAEFAPEIRAYREAYEAAGHQGRGQVYLRVPAYLAETEERAREEPQESLMHFYREQAQRLRDSLSRAGTRAIEGRAERLKRIENLTYEEALTGQVLVGTPDQVSKRLLALQDELGIDGILAELNCGGLIPHRQVMTALQLLCQEVRPRFHLER